MEAIHNLLMDPLIGVARAAGTRHQLTLPGLLAGLSDGSVAGLSAVAAHQRQAVFRMLVQLAAIALRHEGREYNAPLPTDEATWVKLLRRLTPEHSLDEPWCLFVSDVAKPAFMQPAVLDAKEWIGYKKVLETSDMLDVLILAKGHDVKGGRAQPDDPESWLYALISLQTTQGFLGVGNQGISRMNGGFGSRCFISRAPGLGISERFVRDVKMLLYQRPRIVDEYGYLRDDGLALVWLASWDTDIGLTVGNLDPFYIGICRRIRMIQPKEGELAAVFKTSVQPRINAKESKGNVGDPWIPVDKNGSALTVPGDGFTTQRKCDILLGGQGIERRPLSLEHVPGVDDSSDMFFIGSVLVRGQGKTEGLHEFAILVPPAVRNRLSSDPTLGVRAQQMLDQARDMRLRVLGPALLTLLQGGADDLNFKDGRDRDWRDHFTAEVDRVFFDYLWRYALAVDDAERDKVFIGWVWRLQEVAHQALTQAMSSLPVPAARRVRAEAQAENMFYGGFYKHFGVSIKSSQEEENAA